MPSTWTVPGESRKDSLLRHAETSVPRFYSKSARGREEMNGLAELLGNGVLAATDDLLQMTFIGSAERKWLAQHAKDAAVSPQDGEPPDILRERIRHPEDAVTRPFLLAAINNLLAVAGVSGTAAMAELRRDRAFFGTYTARTGTGGVFATEGSVRTFTPTVPFPLPVEVGYARSGAQGNPRLVLSGAAQAGNNGTFEVTSLLVDSAGYTNASHVDGADAGVSWSLRKYDVEGHSREGFARAYLSRGYRARKRRAIVVILPLGSSAALVDAVADLLRLKKAAGFPALVEREI